MIEYSVGDIVSVRATVRKILEDGAAAVDIPTHVARVTIRPARKAKVGQVLEMEGDVTRVLDHRLAITGEAFGKVIVDAAFVTLKRKAAASVYERTD